MAIHEIAVKECATGMHWGEKIVVLSVGKNYRHCLDELFTPSIDNIAYTLYAILSMTHRSWVASHGIRVLCSIREDPGRRDGQSLFVCKKTSFPSTNACTAFWSSVARW